MRQKEQKTQSNSTAKKIKKFKQTLCQPVWKAYIVGQTLLSKVRLMTLNVLLKAVHVMMVHTIDDAEDSFAK